eukprot:gene36855-22985_t
MVRRAPLFAAAQLAAAAPPPPKYRYHNTDSGLFCIMDSHRNRVSPRPTDPLLAADPEADLWFRIQAWAQSRARDRHKRGPYVDVGCGIGRIVLRFGPLFGAGVVHCVEPDAPRMAVATAAVTELDLPPSPWGRRPRAGPHGEG